MKSYLFVLLTVLMALVSFVQAQNWQCPILRGDVDKKKIISDYGPRNDPNGSWFHLGIDLGYPKGTPIYAVERGRAYYDGTKHKIVRIMHPFRYRDYDSLPSRYLHNDTVIIDTPRYVNRDDLIAYVGDAGCRPGFYHLHFEFGLYRRPRYQPLRFLPYDNAHDPEPIAFLKPQPNETVFGYCPLALYLTFSEFQLLF